MSEEKPWFCQKCRVMMAPVDGDHCKCPVCGSEVWYDYSVEKDDIEKLMEDSIVHHQKNVYEAMIGGKPVKGGGGGNGKNHNKKSMDKPTTNELYKRLSK